MESMIARWTTPSVYFKPSEVPVDTIAEIYLIFKQSGRPVIIKCKDCASIVSDGFLWTLDQEDTCVLDPHQKVKMQIDYITDNGMRYTTLEKAYTVTDSGLDEVI